MKILSAEATGLELDGKNIVVAIDIVVPDQEINIIRAQEYARLIASAPMMLDALERADELIDLLIIDNTDTYVEERAAIRAAIRAAKGE